MLEKSQEELEQMAAAINTLAAFCGKRDLPRLSREELRRYCGVSRADCMMLFGESIPCAGDVAAQAIQEDMVDLFMIVGGERSTTDSLRRKFHRAFWDIEVTGKMEADIFAEYLYRQYGIAPDWIERDSRNFSDSIANALFILRENQVFPKTILVIQDAVMQRRAEEGLRKYLGDSVTLVSYAGYQVQVRVRDGGLTFVPGDVLGMWEMDEYIALLLREIPRLRDDQEGYGPKGKDRIAHVEIPPEVLEAYEVLRAAVSSDEE